VGVGARRHEPEGAKVVTSDPAQELVLVRQQGAITRITLNRARAVNALSKEMAIAVHQGVIAAAQSGSQTVLLDGSGERGFCGGGDVKAMVAAGVSGALSFLQKEYRADLALHNSVVPVVSIMDGITMGGGIGLTGHTAFRVVTERSHLAMPETRIGIMPDVGGNLLLSRAPGRVGELLAITSGSFGAGDAIAFGFADYFVPSERLDELREVLKRGEDAVSALSALSAPAPEPTLTLTSAWFDPIADRALGTPAQTLAHPIAAAGRLITELESAHVAEAADLAATIRAMCPTSVVIAIAQLARTRSAQMDLAEVLTDDYRVLGRMIRRQDFAEGVRAQLVEKDLSPRWDPARIEELDPATIDAILDPASVEGESPLVL
jgi:enoyl-CoA hydratase